MNVIKFHLPAYWTLIGAFLSAPSICWVPSSFAEIADTSSPATRVTYYITPDYAEVWGNGERVEIIKHYRINRQKVATRDAQELLG